MSRLQSWHIPSARRGTPDDILVLFTQRRAKESIQEAIDKLSEGDGTASLGHELRNRSIEPTRGDVRLRQLVSYPWIRDHDFQPNAICVFLDEWHRTEEQQGLRASILLETDFEDRDCILVTSRLDGSSGLVVSAARVSVQSARVLASQILDNQVTLEEAMGEEFEENQVNLAAEYPLKLEPPPSTNAELPDFSDVKHSDKDRLTIISLLPLGLDKVQSLKSKLDADGVEIDVIDRLQRPLSRDELYLLHETLEAQNNDEGHINYIFFVDSIPDTDGELQIIAACRRTNYGNYTSKHQISLLPVKADGIVPLWRASLSAKEEPEEGRLAPQHVEEQHAYIFQRERVRDARKVFVGDGRDSEDIGTVWFLKPFSLIEQRQIRVMFGTQHDYDVADAGHEFLFAGNPFSDDKTHTIQDLATLFQQCDPLSPTFDPSKSTTRFNGYPHHFFAVDQRIFAKDAVILGASTIDFYHDTSELGWYQGTTEPQQAFSAYVNLDIANMGSQELFEDGDNLWLDDLKAYSKEYDPEDFY